MPELLGDEKVGIRYSINGLISMTPDGHPLLGPAPEVDGLWSAAASWIKEGPGVGRVVAEWMSGQVPSVDVDEANIARFYPSQRTVAHVQARAREGFNKMYGIVHPAEQWESGRPVRVSPVYDRERDLGAVFFETAGWERPHWYASNEPLLERYAGRLMPRDAERDAGWWSPIINAEHLAMRDGCGLVYLSAFAIFDVIGPSALDVVQTLAVAQLDVVPGRVIYTSLLDERGGFKADLTIMRLGAERFRVVTGGATGQSDLAWFAGQACRRHRRAGRPGDFAQATLGLWGPQAREVLASVTGDDVSHGGFPFGTCREVEIAGLSRAGLADLLRRRARLGTARADGAGGPALGRAVGGGQAGRPGAGRYRRLRHGRAGEGVPRLRQRADPRLQPGRGRHDTAAGEGAPLHRQGRLPRAAGAAAGGGAVHADRGRPPVGQR